MGNWDKKNWLIKVELKENLTDARFFEFFENNQVYTEKEYDRFEKSLIMPLYNSKAREIVDFFIEYKNGILMPNKYNCFDPIKHEFSIEKIANAIQMLCWPAGCLCLKKNRIYDVEIQNHQAAIVFEDGISVADCRPPRENMTTITMYFSKTKVKDCSTLFCLADDMFSALGAASGCVIDQEDLHMVYECKKLAI